MNQYHHSQSYTNFQSNHHFHPTNITASPTTVFQTSANQYNLPDENYVYTSLPPSKHHQVSYIDSSISENSYEQFSIDNPTTHDSTYNQIQSYDQCHNYSNNLHLTEQSYGDFSTSTTNPTQFLEQSSMEQQPMVNEKPYKWMQIKRAPAKTSGIL